MIHELGYRDKVIIPDKYNTGVENESALIPVAQKFPGWDGYMTATTITSNGGYVFENIIFTNTIAIKASQISHALYFKNCKFDGATSYAVSNSGDWNNSMELFFDHCEFSGYTSAAVKPFDKTIFRNCKIHHMPSDGLKGGLSNGGFENCYIYDIGYNNPEAHADGVQTTGGNTNLYIKNCRFDVPTTKDNVGNAGIFFVQEYDSVDAEIKDILINGGNYSLYIGIKEEKTATIIGLTGSNIKIGASYAYGRANITDAQYQNWNSNGTITDQDKLFASSVFTGANGKIKVIVSNYTESARTLILVSDKETQTYTVPAHPTSEQLSNLTFADLPYDLEYEIEGNYVICYDGSISDVNEIRFAYATVKQLFSDIADAVRSKTGSQDLIPRQSLPEEISNMSGATLGTKSITINGTYDAEDDNLDGYSSVIINVSDISRHKVPQAGTWQFKTTPTKGYLIIGKDDDTADSAQFVRMVTGYGFPVVLNTQHMNQEDQIGNDADGEYTTYPTGSISRFPNGTTINALNKLVLSQNLGEVAQHDTAVGKTWDSSLLTGEVLDTFYSTYTTGGGLKSKSDFKDAIIATYANTDVEQGASRVAEQRALLESDLDDVIDTIGMWGGKPTFTIDNINIGDTTPLLCGTQKISRVQNYQGDGLLNDTHSANPYYISRNSSGLTPSAIGGVCQTAYEDRRCIEAFHHYYLDGTKAKWDDFKTTMDTIKSYVDQGKIEVVTRKQYYELGEFATNPIVSLSLIPDKVSYNIGDTITASNFTCKANLQDSTQIICGDDKILDYSDVDTSTAGTYTAYLEYKGFKTSVTVSVVASGFNLPAYVQEQTDGYYQSFRFTNDMDKCYCIYLGESNNGFSSGSPFVSGGSVWCWNPASRGNTVRVFYSSDGTATWTETGNVWSTPATIKSDNTTYFGNYTFDANTALTVVETVHIGA